MKLKCVDHNRRVMVLDNSKVLHRSDGSECNTEQVTMGPVLYLPRAITHWVHIQQADMICIHNCHITSFHFLSECSS